MKKSKLYQYLQDNKKRTNDLNTSQSSCSSRYSKTDSDEEDSNEEEAETTK